MPDSFGKRDRDRVKARKALQRDERRVARAARKRARAANADADPRVTRPEPEAIAPGTATDGISEDAEHAAPPEHKAM